MIDRQGKIAVNSGTSLVQETKKELRLLRNNRMSSAKDTRCHTGLQNWIRSFLCSTGCVMQDIQILSEPFPFVVKYFVKYLVLEEFWGLVEWNYFI